MSSAVLVERVNDRLIRIKPRGVDVIDVLEFAEATIMRFGWRKGDRSSSAVNAVEKEGASLHDAIGYACEQLSDAVSDRRGAGTKDWTVRGSDGLSQNLRRKATDMVEAEMPEGKRSDIEFNDGAESADEVLDVLRRAQATAEQEAA